jgi:hypothetical protein
MLFESSKKKYCWFFCTTAFNPQAVSVFQADSPIAGLDSQEVNIPNCKIPCRTVGNTANYFSK